MSSFTRTVDYQSAGPGMFEITKSFKFYKDRHQEGEYIEVPEGFRTNFMSSPAWTHKIYKPTDDTVRAASCVHDGMVGEFGHYLPIMFEENIVRRATWNEAAYWYLLALQARGTPVFWCCVFYVTVIAYGFYKKARNTGQKYADLVKRIYKRFKEGS